MEEGIIAQAKIGPNGRIIIPKKVREIMKLEEGDQVFWKIKGKYIIFGKVETVFKEEID